MEANANNIGNQQTQSSGNPYLDYLRQNQLPTYYEQLQQNPNMGMPQMGAAPGYTAVNFSGLIEPAQNNGYPYGYPQDQTYYNNVDPNMNYYYQQPQYMGQPQMAQTQQPVYNTAFEYVMNGGVYYPPLKEEVAQQQQQNVTQASQPMAQTPIEYVLNGGVYHPPLKEGVSELQPVANAMPQPGAVSQSAPSQTSQIPQEEKKEQKLSMAEMATKINETIQEIERLQAEHHQRAEAQRAAEAAAQQQQYMQQQGYQVDMYGNYYQPQAQPMMPDPMMGYGYQQAQPYMYQQPYAMAPQMPMYGYDMYGNYYGQPMMAQQPMYQPDPTLMQQIYQQQFAGQQMYGQAPQEDQIITDRPNEPNQNMEQQAQQEFNLDLSKPLDPSVFNDEAPFVPDPNFQYVPGRIKPVQFEDSEGNSIDADEAIRLMDIQQADYSQNSNADQYVHGGKTISEGTFNPVTGQVTNYANVAQGTPNTNAESYNPFIGMANQQMGVPNYYNQMPPMMNVPYGYGYPQQQQMAYPQPQMWQQQPYMQQAPMPQYVQQPYQAPITNSQCPQPELITAYGNPANPLVPTPAYKYPDGTIKFADEVNNPINQIPESFKKGNAMGVDQWLRQRQAEQMSVPQMQSYPQQNSTTSFMNPIGIPINGRRCNEWDTGCSSSWLEDYFNKPMTDDDLAAIVLPIEELHRRAEEQKKNPAITGFDYFGNPIYANSFNLPYGQSTKAQQEFEKAKENYVDIQVRLSKIYHAYVGDSDKVDWDAKRKQLDPWYQHEQMMKNRPMDKYERLMRKNPAELTPEETEWLKQDRLVKECMEITEYFDMMEQYRKWKDEQYLINMARVKESHDAVLGLKPGQKCDWPTFADNGWKLLSAIETGKRPKRDGTKFYSRYEYRKALSKSTGNAIPIDNTDDEYVPICDSVKGMYKNYNLNTGEGEVDSLLVFDDNVSKSHKTRLSEMDKRYIEFTERIEDQMVEDRDRKLREGSAWG